MRALIVCSTNPRAALTAARCLTDAGWRVCAVASDHHGPLSWSRRIEAVYPLPSIDAGLDPFIDTIERAVVASGAEIVLPAGDAELLALSHCRSRLSAIVPFAGDDVVRRMVDKLELMAAARRAGLDSPETRVATDQAIREASLPVMVKSRFHWLPEHADRAPARLEASLCTTDAEVRAAVEAIQGEGGEPLLQDYSTGTLMNVHMVADRDGTLLGIDQQTGVGLLYPLGVGIRTRSISVPLDERLVEGVGRMLKDVGWFGFAGLQFFAQDDECLVVDFNGRIPGNLAASYTAGVNYTAAWAALATDRPPPPLDGRRVGERFQWLEGDLRRAVKERRGGLARDVAGTLWYAVGAGHTIGHWDEPVLITRYAGRQLRQLAAGRNRSSRRVAPA